MYYIFLFLLAIIPSIIILTMIYRKDKEKEPKKLLLCLFAAGILSCFVTLFLSNNLESIFPFFNSENVKLYTKNYIYLFVYCFFGIGLIEEFSKWLFIYNITWNNKNFDHIYDSIVYSVFVSLGFATFENILYVMTEGVRVAILRSIFSVPGHASFAIIMGYYIGMAKLTSVKGNATLSKKYKVLSIILPALVHALFDFLLFSNNLFLLLIFLIFIIYIYIKAIKKVNQFSRIEVNLDDKRYCIICGKVVSGNYCSNCGAKIED